MKHDLTMEQVISIISSAFEPLRCVATSQDRGNGLQYEVTDGDESLLFQDGLFRHEVTDSRRLDGIITHARSSLEERGHVLLAWSFPNVA